MPPSVALLEAQPITADEVRAVARANREAGYRLVTISVTQLENETLDILFTTTRILKCATTG